MKTHKIRDFLIRKKDVVDIEDEKYYRRLTIRAKNQGVSLRDEEIGTNIGTKKQFIAKGGQFIVSKIDAMNGAFGIIPIDIKEAIITGNFWTYDVDTSLVNIEWFNMFVSLPSFIKLCEELSSGTTHRKYLDENKFSNYEMLLPSIEEQNSIVGNFIKHKALSENLLNEISKQEKYVSSFRQAILQQAVEGKLCEQDPTDEPASVILEKINEEKEKLIKEKKIKKQKELPPITDKETPFELPQGWKWCRFSNVIDIRDGTHDSPPYVTNGGYPLITGKDFYGGKLDFTKTQYIAEEDYKKVIARSITSKGDILFSMIGGNIGSMVMLEEDYEIAIKNVALFKRDSNSFLNQKFVFTFLKSQVECFKQIAQGGAQSFVSLSLIRNYVLPLPPLAEQQRIVEKVDRLMVLCDELEQEIVNAKRYASQLMEALLQESFSNKKEKTKDNVIEFAPIPKPTKQHLLAAARGNMREDTWRNLRIRALELAGEESK